MSSCSRQNIGSWLHQNILLPLYDGDQYRGLAGRMAELQSFDSLRVGEQVDLLGRRVRGMLDHAYKTSPYYRMVFDQIRFRSEDWEYGEPLPLPELPFLSPVCRKLKLFSCRGTGLEEQQCHVPTDSF